MDIKDILEELTPQDITNILESLGAETSSHSNSKQIIFTSICHNRNDKFKLYYYTESQTFHCYSSCSHIGNLIDLLVHINHYEVKDAILEIKEFFGYSNITVARRGFKKKKRYTKHTINTTEIEKQPTPDKPFIYLLHKQIRIQSWEEDGISYETLVKFNIRYDISNNQILIPHFCPIDDNRVIGIRCREVDELKIERFGKYHPYYTSDSKYAHKLGESLYGFNVNKHNIKKYKKAIIVEGEKGVLQYDNFYPDSNICVALCGSSMSLVQKKLLADIGVESILFCLDKQYQTEEEKELWKNKVYKMALELVENGIECYMLLDDIEGLTGYKDSPLDCGKEIFLKLVQNKMKIEGDTNEI